MQQRDPEITHVAMLMGGWSNEREVSLSSGKACTMGLEDVGYKVTQIDVQPDIIDQLRDLKPDVAFNALHGKWGEDGHIQAVLETMKIPYTHSGVLASALAMDKHLCKSAVARAKVPVVEHRVVTLSEAIDDEILPEPYVVKPVADGSSVGVHIVDKGKTALASMINEEGFDPASQVMVERYVPGRELTCAVMGNVALGVTEVVSADGFYDYTAKYKPGGSEHILPADLTHMVYHRVQKYALAAHTELGCKGVSRSDFRYNDTEGTDGELIFMEINTQPGMTATSLVPEMAAHAGHDFSELLTWMINDAGLER
ncbi:MAG: D-alanine--D-alanine ligase [Pseudomonadota bacterium]